MECAREMVMSVTEYNCDCNIAISTTHTPDADEKFFAILYAYLAYRPTHIPNNHLAISFSILIKIPEPIAYWISPNVSRFFGRSLIKEIHSHGKTLKTMNLTVKQLKMALFSGAKKLKSQTHKSTLQYQWSVLWPKNSKNSNILTYYNWM